MLEQQLQDMIARDIPLTRAMGLRVREINPDGIILSAPIENNVNHQNTAFGGSLFSLAVLSGWCLLLNLLDENDLSGNIVIQDSEIKYLQPVDSEIIAQCNIALPEQISRFLKIYRRKGLARINLQAKILSAENIAVEFSGNYVVNKT